MITKLPVQCILPMKLFCSLCIQQHNLPVKCLWNHYHLIRFSGMPDLVIAYNVLAASCHCVALDVEGRCYTWGRNEVLLNLRDSYILLVLTLQHAYRKGSWDMGILFNVVCQLLCLNYQSKLIILLQFLFIGLHFFHGFKGFMESDLSVIFELFIFW